LPGGGPDAARDAIFQPAFLQDVQTNDNPLHLDARKNDLLGCNPGARATPPARAAFGTHSGNCHGTYEPLFCHAQARSLFDTVR